MRHTGQGVQWTLSAYYNDYSDYIYANPTGEIEDDLPVFAYLQQGAKFHGLEAEVNVPLLDAGDQHLELRLASDYVRGKLDNGVAERVVASIAEGCRQAGAALIGGETAEMPGMYAAGDYDHDRRSDDCGRPYDKHVPPFGSRS